MALLFFDQEASDSLDALERSSATERLAERLSEALRRLESDPGDSYCRRTYFSSVDLWCISVADADSSIWWILWKSVAPEDDDWLNDAGLDDYVVFVAYVGPEAKQFRR
jgi:hypothetical protein